MGRPRRRKGEYKWFILKDPDGDPLLWKEGAKLYWSGPYNTEKFYEYQTCGFEWFTEAQEQAFNLAIKQPDLMGKLRVECEWIPEPACVEKARRNKRRRELRAMRKISPSYLYVVMWTPGDGQVPEYLKGFWPGRQDWVFFVAHAVGFNTKSRAEKVAFDIAVADDKKLGKLFIERWKSNFVGTSEEKLSGLSH